MQTDDRMNRVVTKKGTAPVSGNYVGFIRVRRRELKRRSWKSAMSFDLVRAVRVKGQPRHKFLLGLGTQRGEGTYNNARFWIRAILRMIEYGLNEQQRCQLVTEMVRKGACLPTVSECEECAKWDWAGSAAKEIIHIMESGRTVVARFEDLR